MSHQTARSDGVVDEIVRNLVWRPATSSDPDLDRYGCAEVIDAVAKQGR